MKKLLADLFAKKEKSRHAAAAKKPVRLPRLRDIHFRSIRARGMFVGSGLVLLAIIISLAAYTLSLQAYYYSATRASLQAKAETASAFLSSYVDRTYAEFYQRAFNLDNRQYRPESPFMYRFLQNLLREVCTQCPVLACTSWQDDAFLVAYAVHGAAQDNCR